MKIGKIELKNNLVLAPMAGVTDFAFRDLSAQSGAALTYTEMLSAAAMNHNSKKTEDMTITGEHENPKACQIFGKDPSLMAQAASSSILDKFDIIDINMGCPAPKIVKNGEGASLMKNLPLAAKIIEACVKATSKPITVKFRKGFNSDNSKEFARMCEEAGASAITIHGRTREEFYSGSADYEAIAGVKASVKIPVIGNGDVIDRKSYELMLLTKVDGVMIGRGAEGKPYIFGQILNDKYKFDKYQIVKAHIDMLRKFYEEKWLTLYMRKHLVWYAKNLPNAAQYKSILSQTSDLNAALEILHDLFLKDYEQNV